MPNSPQCTNTYVEVSQGNQQGNQQENPLERGGDTRVEGQYNLAALELEQRVNLQDGVIARLDFRYMWFHVLSTFSPKIIK